MDMQEIRIFLLAMGFGWATCAWAADNVPPKQQLDFLPHYMKTVFLPLQSYSDGKSVKTYSQQPIVEGWKENIPENAGFIIAQGKGINGEPAIAVDSKMGKLTVEPPNELYQDIAVKWLEKQKYLTASFSVSAWVWSNQSGGAYLKLSNQNGRESISAFHSGSGKWENLTVVFPYEEEPEKIRLTLITTKGKAIYSEIKPIITYDDRFNKSLPDACNPLREKVTYLNDGRIRIVVVGNSTVNGHAVANKRASFPYVLQLKLEAYFPGRFEVVNFGLCGWHLPPQIVTINNAFNGNKACDGANWCGGKEGQFTHLNMLNLEMNIDRNTPTISQLNPKVIIFAGMWNDVWRVLKYAGWGIPPNSDEVNRSNGKPSSVEYFQAAFNYADNPNLANLRAANNIFKKAMMPIDQAMLSHLEIKTHSALVKSKDFDYLKENAAQKFRYLSEEFIRRARLHSEVWSMSLPGRLGSSYENASEKLQKAGLLSKEKVESFLMNGYIDAETERIQNQELALASINMGANFLDLSKSYHDQYSSMSISEQFDLGYFLENVEDNVHFKYRGNEWIADQIFLGFRNEFDRLIRQQ